VALTWWPKHTPRILERRACASATQSHSCWIHGKSSYTPCLLPVMMYPSNLSSPDGAGGSCPSAASNTSHSTRCPVASGRNHVLKQSSYRSLSGLMIAMRSGLLSSLPAAWFCPWWPMLVTEKPRH
jgi:hypothetical protein